jgi:Tfp pilus assembly protein FimT
MPYQIKYKNTGFSLVEILVIISIIAIFATISTTVYTSLRSKNSLEIATNDIVGAMRLAKTYSEQVNSDSKWGVYITSEELTIFSGTSYASRDTNKDKLLKLPGSVSVSGMTEVVFEKSSGITNTTGNISVNGIDGVKNISINEKGTITY